MAAGVGSTARPLRTFLGPSCLPACLSWVCCIFDLMTINLLHDHKAAVTTLDRRSMSQARKKGMRCYKQSILMSLPSIRKQHILPRSPPKPSCLYLIGQNCITRPALTAWESGKASISLFWFPIWRWVRKKGLGVAVGLATHSVCHKQLAHLNVFSLPCVLCPFLTPLWWIPTLTLLLMVSFWLQPFCYSIHVGISTIKFFIPSISNWFFWFVPALW